MTRDRALAIGLEGGPAHVTGAALYTDDVGERLHGALHAWPVLAPHAHARVTALDVGVALAEPGVVEVLTAADVPGEATIGPLVHDEPLFPSEVVFHQQPVAWVLGDSIGAAQRGAARVTAAYEVLPAILTIEAAIAADSFLTEPIRIARGDLSRMAASALVFEGELALGGQEHFYLETQAALARLDESGGLTVLASTQHPSEMQEVVARVLALPRHQITVECARMGGGFGGKEVQATAFGVIAALGAWKTRRPVRVRLPRRLDMAITGKRHPYLVRYTAGVAADGRIEALRLWLYSDGGWSADLSEPVMWRSLLHADNAYFLPAVEVIGRVCRTHKTSQTAFRGFGGPQAMIAVEEVLAQTAQRLSLPPEVVRARNFYRSGETTPYGQVVDQADRLHVIWRSLQRSSGFDERRAEVAAFNAAHADVKRGLAITPVKFGISFTATLLNQGGALVLVYRDGTVQVNHGGTDMGQGLHAKIRQLAADRLGVSRAAVRVMPTRTDKIPNTSATAASASTDLNGAAVVAACEQIRSGLIPVAAELLSCAPDDVRFEGDRVSGGGAAVPFAEVCDAAYLRRVPLFAHGFYRTPDLHFDTATGQGRPFYYFTYGAAVSEVEVDGFTGETRLRRVDVLQDVGDSIAPAVDRGQIEGGFLQGVGLLTVEELLWDGEGRLVTGGASTYKVPSWSDCPEEFHVSFLGGAAQPGVVAGSKAVGEPPVMLAISVREAIRDAVAAFGDRAVVTFASPATPERVFFAIEAARQRGAPQGRTEEPVLVRVG